ncbi:hypothetical protein DYB37_001089 [Aphanomyces astaci]|uniref:PX domain-containing protein n=1 Tax=Aphanomyces astaci TaxID=112090 RepID=A0A3R7EBX8_APHAT|nr:hypothetical protein DYB35_000827 [Aphanomyces astaci]RHZ25544.1 hypothetical protein DYB37_001089 [Aphanomyces astaci]
MGQVVSCCFGMLHGEESPRHPKGKDGGCMDGEGLYTLMYTPVVSPKSQQHVVAPSAITHDSCPTTTSNHPEVETTLAPTAIVCEDSQGTPSNTTTNEIHPCEDDIVQRPEPIPAILVTQRSRSTSDMLTDTLPSRPSYGRSNCTRRLLPTDKDPTTTSLVVGEAARVNLYVVTVQHFTPHLTGSVYDFSVNIHGRAVPVNVMRTRHACKVFYAKLQKLHHHQWATSTQLPPFPPKAGFGLVKTAASDSNSCSFMQDFLDHLLAIPAVRSAPITLAFFHITDAVAPQAC